MVSEKLEKIKVMGEVVLVAEKQRGVRRMRESMPAAKNLKKGKKTKKLMLVLDFLLP